MNTVANQLLYLSPNEVRKTLPSYVVSEVVMSTAINSLNQLIRLTNDRIALAYSEYEMIPFTVSDLLRCKCSGKVEEVLQVIRKLQDHKKLKIVRIKDRLDTQNEDFLINIKLNDCPIICEVQVGFKSGAD